MNSIQLIGRLTADPEQRFTNDGKSVTTIRLAVPRRKSKGGTEPQPVYVNVVIWGTQGEAVAKHMTKGRRVSVSGRLEYREWEDNEGSRHSMHEVVANQVEFLDPPPKGSPAAAGDEPTYDYGEEPF